MASSFVFDCDFTLLKSHFTGLFTDDNLLYDYQVLTAAWAIGVLPKPASLEKRPLAIPNRIVSFTIAAVNSPTAAVGLEV